MTAPVLAPEGKPLAFEDFGPASPGMLKAQEAADSASSKSLESVRESAGKWQTTITTMIGLFALSGFVKGPDDFAKVASSWQWGIPWILGLIALTGVSAVLLAGRAANGLPKKGWSDAADYMGRQQTAADDAASALRWAITLAVVAFGLLVLMVGILWFAPRAPAETSNSLVTTRSAVYCGPIAPSPNGIEVADTLGGSKVDVPAADIIGMQQVRTCPE